MTKAISSTPRPWRHWTSSETCSQGVAWSARTRTRGQRLPALDLVASLLEKNRAYTVVYALSRPGSPPTHVTHQEAESQGVNCTDVAIVRRENVRHAGPGGKTGRIVHKRRIAPLRLHHCPQHSQRPPRGDFCFQQRYAGARIVRLPCKMQHGTSEKQREIPQVLGGSPLE